MTFIKKWIKLQGSKKGTTGIKTDRLRAYWLTE